MKPIVAIVGRPNVGKSTLFNRISGRRKAIVWDEPGVTRDRNYSDVEWKGKAFTLIDTGGFEPVSKDQIFVQMREQCELAMDEAEVILFLMDGKEGLTSSDKEIVDILRKLNKPVFYIVNKIDGPKHEERILEFYGLGMETLFSISAEHGYGINGLMEEVSKALPELAEEKRDKDITKVAVIGRPNVGKSSLINRLLGYKRVLVDKVPGTTRDAIDTRFEKEGRKYVLIDTAGIRRKSRISLRIEKYSIVEALRTIDRSDVALLLLDSKEGVTDQDARIGGFIHEKGKGCILIVNKWDLVEKDSHTMARYEEEVRENLKYLSYAPILFISTLTGQRVGKVLDVVEDVSAQTRKRIPTSQLNKHFGKWVEKFPPPLYKNRSVKMNYITQVSISPPTFVIYTNIPEGVHFSYERYLLNQMREAFGFGGVSMRLLFRKKIKKYLIGITILIVVLAGGLLIYRFTGQSATDQKFRFVRAERGDITFVVTATGTINPVINVLVGSQVSGTIKALHADFNSQVKEGQVIAQIDPAIFQAQVDQAKATVSTNQANLLNSQSSLANAKANLVKAEVAVLDTKRTLDRYLPLVEKKVIAQATMDTAQTNFETALAQRDVAKAQVESATSQVASSKAQVEQAKAALRMAETNLRYTTIRSPVNGTVISRNVDVGQTVAASLQAPTLFTIAKDLTQMQVDSNVSEADVGRIRVGQEATFTVDAYPERIFRGKVSEIRNAPIIVQNVVTYDVVIVVDNKELKLKPGMTANVSVMIARREGVLKIPNAALRFRPESAKQGSPAEKTTESPSSTGRLSVERLTTNLNLTKDQQVKVEMILKSSRGEIQEINQKMKPEEAKVRIRGLIRQKISGILTDEQANKLKELSESSQPERSPGKVWMISPEGQPSPVSITLGITDGAFSEVAGGDLSEGTEVIVEELSAKKNTSQRAPQPSMRGIR